MYLRLDNGGKLLLGESAGAALLIGPKVPTGGTKESRKQRQSRELAEALKRQARLRKQQDDNANRAAVDSANTKQAAPVKRRPQPEINEDQPLPFLKRDQPQRPIGPRLSDAEYLERLSRQITDFQIQSEIARQQRETEELMDEEAVIMLLLNAY